jgi:hypothetical protein
MQRALATQDSNKLNAGGAVYNYLVKDQETKIDPAKGLPGCASSPGWYLVLR